jgi:glutathione S-transferase
MSELILHHYALSPYSEKIRIMLGYAGLPWQSVITKEMPPRPLLQALAGGYQRIPVAQIGADVFCDSNVIAEEIARLAGNDDLCLGKASEAIQAFVHLAEGEVFFACVLAGSSASLRKKAMQSMSLWELGRFVVDRVGMARKAAKKPIAMKQARPVAENFIQTCENMLAHDYLFGDSATIADFSAYHCLWFIRDLGEHGFIHHYPKVIAWMDRLSARRAAPEQELSAEQALAIAAASQPRALARAQLKGERLGQQVSIAPDDYRLDPTAGELVAETATRWILRRNDKRAGLVHTHFPKQGYSLR